MLKSIHKVYKVEIKPTNKQREILNKNFGCIRFTYNWCVEKFIDNSKKEVRIPFNIYQYMKDFTQFKKTNEQVQFLIDTEISSFALYQSIINFDKSVIRFFKNKNGFPQFKKKGKCRDSYREYNICPNQRKDKKGPLRTSERRIHIPKLGWTKIKGKPEKYLPQDKVIKYITILRDVDKYYISIYYINDILITDDNVEQNNPTSFGVIGIDLGIKNLMTICHDDESLELIENEDFTKKYSEKLSKEQKKLTKKQLGSNNRNKQKLKVSKIHRKIRNSRNDKIHKITNYITSKTKNSVIMMENLNTKDMIINGNRHLSRSLSNVSFGEILRQMDYKSLKYGSRLDLIPSNYPSTKLCSGCGSIMEISLEQREYECENPHCIYHVNPIDRDYNSSINIRDYYFKYPRLA